MLFIKHYLRHTRKVESTPDWLLLCWETHSYCFLTRCLHFISKCIMNSFLNTGISGINKMVKGIIGELESSFLNLTRPSLPDLVLAGGWEERYPHTASHSCRLNPPSRTCWSWGHEMCSSPASKERTLSSVQSSGTDFSTPRVSFSLCNPGHWPNPLPCSYW